MQRVSQNAAPGGLEPKHHFLPVGRGSFTDIVPDPQEQMMGKVRVYSGRKESAKQTKNLPEYFSIKCLSL